MKICISIPVHERPDVIRDQILNFRFYLPNCIIVLHKSRNFIETVSHGSFDDLAKIEGVFVNPVSLPTWSRWGSFAHVHNSNFEFAHKNLDFDYFCLHASNDMFVKAGAKDYIARFDCGNHNALLEKDSGWALAEKIFADPDLKKIMESVNLQDICGSQVEGMFFRREIFAEMIKIIERFYDFSNVDLNYERAEVYYPTLARKFATSFGMPYVFSSVVANIPENLFEVVELIRGDKLSKAALASIYRNYRPRLNVKISSFADLKTFAIKKGKELVKALIKCGKARNLSGFRFDIESISQSIDSIYKPENTFAIKRVDRVFDDPLRTKIREMMETEQESRL